MPSRGAVGVEAVVEGAREVRDMLVSRRERETRHRRHTLHTRKMRSIALRIGESLSDLLLGAELEIDLGLVLFARPVLRHDLSALVVATGVAGPGVVIPADRAEEAQVPCGARRRASDVVPGLRDATAQVDRELHYAHRGGLTMTMWLGDLVCELSIGIV